MRKRALLRPSPCTAPTGYRARASADGQSDAVGGLQPRLSCSNSQDGRSRRVAGRCLKHDGRSRTRHPNTITALCESPRDLAQNATEAICSARDRAQDRFGQATIRVGGLPGGSSQLVPARDLRSETGFETPLRVSKRRAPDEYTTRIFDSLTVYKAEVGSSQRQLGADAPHLA